jgi:hypothetical protein
MATTATPGSIIWSAVPELIRKQLNAGPSLDCRMTGDQYGVTVCVGRGGPLTLLLMSVVEEGVRCELWQQHGKAGKFKRLAAETIHPAVLIRLLQRWIRTYLN